MNLSLRSTMVRLRRYRHDDLDRLASLLTDPAVMDRVGGSLRSDEVAGMLDRYLRDDDPILLAARAAELEDGTFVGSGRLALGSREAPELGYLVHPAHRGRGVATAIARALIELARTEHGFTRVLATVDPDHAASIRVLEKAGMTRRAIERDEEGELLVYAIG